MSKDLARRSMDRRNFLKGTALVAGGAAVAGLAGCAPSSTEASADQGTLAGTGANQEAPTHNPISTEQADVVIVGSGTAGTVAACRAAELGLSVICLEKNSGLGGTSAVAEGFCGIGSKAQAAQNITVDPNAVVADTLAITITDAWDRWCALSPTTAAPPSIGSRIMGLPGPPSRPSAILTKYGIFQPTKAACPLMLATYFPSFSRPRRSSACSSAFQPPSPGCA